MAFKVDINGNVQYANREAGIKAHAEEYSFNIDSELFQQLTPEQQKLWRKEIEQAVVSGGHCGLELAKDKRYDEEPLSEKKCMYSKDNYTNEDRKVLCDGCKEECKFNKKEEPVSENLEEAAKHYLYSNILYDDVYVGNPTDKDCIEMYKAGANWKEQQLLAKAVDGFVIEDIEEGNGDFLLSAEYLPKNIGLKDRQKVKVIVIKDN